MDAEPLKVDFRPVEPGDFPMLWRWRCEPHVQAFYQKTTISLDQLAAHLGPRVRGEVQTICHVALHRGAPFGYLQCYRNADSPEWADLIGAHDGVSLDLHIGEPSFFRRGFGQAMLRGYLSEVAFPVLGEVTAYIAHDKANRQALECSRAVGFQPLRDFIEGGAEMMLLRLSRAQLRSR